MIAKKSIFLLSLVLSLFLTVAPEASQGPAELFKQANDSRHSLENSEKKKKYRHHWLNCIHRYKKIYTRYPESSQAPWAMYYSARLFTGLYHYSFDPDYLDEAITVYRKLARTYKSHRLADDAQYHIGEIYYKYKNDPARAYREFLKVSLRFPSGDMRPRAERMMDKLARILAPGSVKRETRKAESRASGLVPVEDIRYWSTSNYTRVVIDLRDKVKYNYNLLKADPENRKPPRLYLDLQGARITSNLEPSIPIEGSLLRKARAAQHDPHTVRVVLDIESIERYKVFHLHDPYRIVVDVRTGLPEGEGPEPGPSEETAPAGPPSLASTLGLNVQRIVIDPGHGGKDPGCVAPHGVQEKEIVLDMAKMLAKEIEEKTQREVVLTRDCDKFIPLERRTAIANMEKGDLFISLHVNAHRRRDVHGVETYILDMATDERAVMVAARENATSEKNISDLQKILNDLLFNTKVNESQRLAEAVHCGMVSTLRNKYRGVQDLGVKKAPFYVLIGAEMPAVLVETGFLTNGEERKRLLRKSYRRNVARGIANGIEAYIKELEKGSKKG